MGADHGWPNRPITDWDDYPDGRLIGEDFAFFCGCVCGGALVAFLFGAVWLVLRFV